MSNEAYLKSLEGRGLKSDVAAKLEQIFIGESLEDLVATGDLEDFWSAAENFYERLVKSLGRTPNSSELGSGYLSAITILADVVGREDLKGRISSPEFRRRGFEVSPKNQKASNSSTSTIPKIGYISQDGWKAFEIMIEKKAFDPAVMDYFKKNASSSRPGTPKLPEATGTVTVTVNDIAKALEEN